MKLEWVVTMAAFTFVWRCRCGMRLAVGFCGRCVRSHGRFWDACAMGSVVGQLKRLLFLNTPEPLPFVYNQTSYRRKNIITVSVFLLMMFFVLYCTLLY